jgi:hypothetical protein
MGFHTKHEHLFRLNPDNAIIPECANIEYGDIPGPIRKAYNFARSVSVAGRRGRGLN